MLFHIPVDHLRYQEELYLVVEAVTGGERPMAMMRKRVLPGISGVSNRK